MEFYSNPQNIAEKDGSITSIKQKTRDHGPFKKITLFLSSSIKMARDGPVL